MAKPTFENFYGATVTYELVSGTHRFQTIMPFPGAPNDRIVVTTTTGDKNDAMAAYVTNKNDVLAEALNHTSEDDRSLWQKRYDEAHKELRLGQIKRPYLAGNMPTELALQRLQAAGYSLTEAVALLDKDE